MVKTDELTFRPLFFKDRLITVNPCGYAGVVTLWTNPGRVIEKMKSAGMDLNPDTSPISVVGTLYGNGLPELLRNLLYNPQISLLLVVGKDKSGSAGELINFFCKGLEEVDFLGKKHRRIIGTDRIMDRLVSPEKFKNCPDIEFFGDIKDEKNLARLISFMNKLVPSPCPFDQMDRLEIPLPDNDSTIMASNPRNHNITALNGLDAWRELIFRLVRFGIPTQLRKGRRLELQNVKVSIEEPCFIDDGKLRDFGFSPETIQAYYHSFLEPDIPPDFTYTYGNRLGEYFGCDTIEKVIENLNKDPQDRKSYVSLWDSAVDISNTGGHPCMTSLFFRLFEDRLTLTASFRTHNALDGWLVNFYGLMKIQDRVCRGTGLDKGPITMISHSISVDPRHYDRAKSVADTREFQVNPDPNGNFRIEIEDDEIVLRHYSRGIQIDQYRGKNASRIQHELYRNCGVSDINHAIYLGRMLERAENALKNRERFTQD